MDKGTNEWMNGWMDEWMVDKQGCKRDKMRQNGGPISILYNYIWYLFNVNAIWVCAKVEKHFNSKPLYIKNTNIINTCSLLNSSTILKGIALMIKTSVVNNFQSFLSLHVLFGCLTFVEWHSHHSRWHREVNKRYSYHVI